MNFIRKIQTFLILLAKGDFKNIVSILSYNYKVSFLSSAKSKWEWGKNHELTYWDIDLAKLKSGDNYDYRLDINYNLQTRPALLLPNNKFIDILDVVQSINLILTNNYNQLADMDNNQVINILDIVRLVNIIVDPSLMSPEEECAADLNFDGTINILDIVTLVNIVVNESN